MKIEQVPEVAQLASNYHKVQKQIQDIEPIVQKGDEVHFMINATSDENVYSPLVHISGADLLARLRREKTHTAYKLHSLGIEL